MTDFSLRNARQQDAVFIRRMVFTAKLNPTGLDWQRFVVAVNSFGRVIGCVQIKPHRDGTEELASLVVVEDWRSNGVASALIRKMIDAHHGPLYLMCRAGLGSFYQQFGFTVLDLAGMPPYLQRISRLAGGFKKLFRIGEGLLIMGIQA